MNKFLLVAVNAKYIHSNPAVYSLRGYVDAAIRPYVEIAEYTINQSLEDIMADIYARKPRVIGFSCYIWNWRMIQELIEELSKVMPDTPIWLGGPEVSYDAPGILQEYPQVTGIMIGEGEVTFAELLDCYVRKWESQRDKASGCESTDYEVELLPNGVELRNPLNLQNIAGLCLPSGYTPMRELTDMNKLPFLYEDLEPFTNRIIYYESSRGCPYRCSYCLSSIDKKVRLRDIGVVKRELQFFLDKKVSQVKFVDRTFNCDHKHAMEIWQYILENDNGVTNFHFEISADILREEEIALLNRMRPGLVQLEIGVQSTNPQTIAAIDRVMNVEKLEQIVAAVHRGNNIHQHLDLIAGLPFEDYQSFGKSFNRVYAMKPQQLQLGFLKVLKGSPMEEKAQEYGIVYGNRPPYQVLYTKWLSYQEVVRLKQVEEMVEIYYNSNQFSHTLSFLERAFDSAFAMYEKLADFFKEQGYFTNHPARVYRYEILLAFAKEYDITREAIYRELLLYDLYLRENVKSRPSFARDVSSPESKEQIRFFYQKEERERCYLPEYEAYDWKQLSKMTHLESFTYPVWSVELMQGIEHENQWNIGEIRASATEDTYILFDYRKRDPLTGGAVTQIVQKEQRNA